MRSRGSTPRGQRWLLALLLFAVVVLVGCVVGRLFGWGWMAAVFGLTGAVLGWRALRRAENHAR